VTAERLIVWRHGRTAWNEAGRYQGQADVPLDEVGWVQTKTAAATIALSRPTAIFSSDAARARNAAQTLADLAGLIPAVDPRLRELNVGSWEGLTAAEIAAQDPDHVPDQRPGHDYRRSATGETGAEGAARVAAALTDIVEGQPDGAVVVVAMHGEAAQFGVAKMVDLDPHRLGEMLLCSWANLERHRLGHWVMRQYNATVGDLHPAFPGGLIA
jgi:glucosyl-3-phosphoglycerate phosphatase